MVLDYIVRVAELGQTQLFRHDHTWLFLREVDCKAYWPMDRLSLLDQSTCAAYSCLLPSQGPLQLHQLGPAEPPAYLKGGQQRR